MDQVLKSSESFSSVLCSLRSIECAFVGHCLPRAPSVSAFRTATQSAATPHACHTKQNQAIWLVNKAASNAVASAPHVAVLFIISPPDFAAVVAAADGVAVPDAVVADPDVVVVAVPDIVDDVADVDAELIDDPLDKAAITPPWTTDGVLLLALDEALLYPARFVLVSELESTSVDQHHDTRDEKVESLRGIDHSNHAFLAMRSVGAIVPDGVGIINHDGKRLALFNRQNQNACMPCRCEGKSAHPRSRRNLHVAGIEGG